MSALSDRPIGVFDSGVGGLTVVAALRRQLPHEPILYLGDTARLPYGTKSRATVARYSQRNVEFLLGRGVKAVVIACNTASALALPELHPSTPIWGVIEPGSRHAAEISRGRVGVIGTESTIGSDAYGEALRRIRPDLQVFSQACPLFVPLVEEGWHDDPVTEEVARRYLAPLLAERIDTLVLGCTHYPLLRPVIERVVGEAVTLVDSAESTALTVAAGLGESGLRHDERGAEEGLDEWGRDHFCVTDAAERFGRLAGRILGPGAQSLELVEVV